MSINIIPYPTASGMARAIAASTGGMAVQVKYIAVGKGLQSVVLDAAGRAETDTLKDLVGYVEVLHAKQVSPYQWQMTVDLVGVVNFEWNFSEFALCDANKQVIAIYGSATQALMTISTVLDNALLSVNLVLGTFPADSIIIEHHNIPLELFNDDYDAAIFGLQHEVLKNHLADIDRDIKIEAFEKHVYDFERRTQSHLQLLQSSLALVDNDAKITIVENNLSTFQQQMLNDLALLRTALAAIDVDAKTAIVESHLAALQQQMLNELALLRAALAAIDIDSKILTVENTISALQSQTNNELESLQGTSLHIMTDIIDRNVKNYDAYESLKTELLTHDADINKSILRLNDLLIEERTKNEFLYNHLIDLLTNSLISTTHQTPTGDPGVTTPTTPTGDPGVTTPTTPTGDPGVTTNPNTGVVTNHYVGTWALARVSANSVLTMAITWTATSGMTAANSTGITVWAYVLGAWVQAQVVSNYTAYTYTSPIIDSPVVQAPVPAWTAKDESLRNGINTPKNSVEYAAWDIWWSQGGPNYSLSLTDWANLYGQWFGVIPFRYKFKTLPPI